jgi:hypothetical protein
LLGHRIAPSEFLEISDFLAGVLFEGWLHGSKKRKFLEEIGRDGGESCAVKRQDSEVQVHVAVIAPEKPEFQVAECYSSERRLQMVIYKEYCDACGI